VPQRRKLYSFWIDPEHAAALKQRKEQQGITESDQIRQAIAVWLTSPGDRKMSKTRKKTAPRRAPTRRRA
jgi:hypothetical protein